MLQHLSFKPIYEYTGQTTSKMYVCVERGHICVPLINNIAERHIFHILKCSPGVLMAGRKAK